jgi:ribose 5-phosphate isomerase B
MIRRLGTLAGKHAVLGYDRYLLDDLPGLLKQLSSYGPVTQAVDESELHYLSSAQLVCETVANDSDAFGILCCGTGMGMSIAANKFRGIYAARCITVDDAEMARTINNANVLCLAAKSGPTLNAKIIEAFVSNPYQGRKLEQLSQITAFELETPSAPPAAARIVSSLRRTA